MTQFKVDFNDFKRRDNTNLMEITLYKDNGEQITPNRDHQWSGKALKFGDGDKRLDQELAVTIDGDKIGVPSKQLENLPSGDYGLELWEVSNDSKTIYPSAGFVEFHIHRNADESLESVTPTIDIDKVIDDLHQAGLNVVVDDIEMLAPDAKPSVTSEVRDGKNHIRLHIPRGLQGDIGPAPTLKIGTVTKLNPDQAPTANLSGGNGSYTLDMGIPQGPQGPADLSSIKKASQLPAEARDFNYLATHMKTYQGFWWVGDTAVANGPTGGWNWAVIEVIAGNTDTTGVIRTTRFGPGINYSVNVNGGAIGLWTQIANDSNVVHNTGNETIAGDKALVGNTTLATTKILAGNYGLRVTSSGFEKTTDGITWVPANI